MISVIKNSSYGGTIAILVASFLWGTTGTAAAFAPTLGPLAIGAVAMGEVGFTGIDCISGHSGTQTIYWAKYFYYSLGVVAVGIYPLAFILPCIMPELRLVRWFQLVRLHSLQQF